MLLLLGGQLSIRWEQTSNLILKTNQIRLKNSEILKNGSYFGTMLNGLFTYHQVALQQRFGVA